MFKKEFRKKLLVIAGAVLMSCSLLACGSDKKSSDTTAATTKEASQDTTEAEKKEDKTTEKKDDKTTEKKEDKTTEAKKEETTEAKKDETTEAKVEETTAFDTEEGPTTAEDADTSIDPQASANAAMNFIGPYTCGRATANVSVSSDGIVSIEISNPFDAATVYHWTMSGKMNPDTLTVEFENCIKIVEHLDPEEGQPDRESAYKYGAGMLSFADTDDADPTFVWYDETENAGSGMDFVFLR